MPQSFASEYHEPLAHRGVSDDAPEPDIQAGEAEPETREIKAGFSYLMPPSDI